MNKKVDKKQNKVLKYISTGAMILLYSIVFSIFSAVFLIDAIPRVVTIIFGFVFMVPTIVLVFALGRSDGEKDYKEKSKQNTAGGKGKFVVEINYGVSALYILSFAVPVILLLIIGVAINNAIVHGIVYIILMPASLVFATLGVVTTNPITWLSVAVYLPYILLICAAFCVGYILKFETLKNRQRSIESELRMFNN